MKLKEAIERRCFGKILAIGNTHYVTLPVTVMNAAGVRVGEHIVWNVTRGVICGEALPWKHVATLPKGYKRLTPRKGARAVISPNKDAGAA